METAAALLEQNIYVPAIRYPTVARNQARLRVTLTAAHGKEDVATFRDILNEILQ
jgi:7-keto-8-aminopelargonate synthetase-like enzyme